jgi:hypothetical protein
MTKKPKTVRVGNMDVTPITAAKRRALNRKIKEGYKRLRNRYREIRGKRVDWISHNYEEGLLSLQFSPSIVTEGIEFSEMSSGDDVILRQYYRRWDE